MTPDQSRLEADRAAPRAVALWQALTALRSPVVFLQSGAHPDDEISAMLAALRFRDGLDVAYVCSTRGEGGQNDIGRHAGAALGTLRTAEMEAACARLDMEMHWLSEGPDDPIADFGFSKSGEETLGRWGREATLDAFARVLRRVRPDILCPTFLDVPGAARPPPRDDGAGPGGNGTAPPTRPGRRRRRPGGSPSSTSPPGRARARPMTTTSRRRPRHRHRARTGPRPGDGMALGADRPGEPGDAPHAGHGPLARGPSATSPCTSPGGGAEAGVTGRLAPRASPSWAWRTGRRRTPRWPGRWTPTRRARPSRATPRRRCASCPPARAGLRRTASSGCARRLCRVLWLALGARRSARGGRVGL